jgi:hemolysin D
VTALAERFPSIARHWSIFTAAWRDQSERDRATGRRSDHEFLPAALEIMEKPPSPGLRYLLLTLCGLFVVALAWAFIGRVDVVAIASGRTIPAGNSKVIQPIQIGSVRAIHVRNGDFVRAGQLLIELDPTVATAEAAQSDQSLLSANLVKARSDAVLAYLSGRPATFFAPAGTPPHIAQTQERLVRTAIASYESERSSLVQQRAARAAERDSAGFEIAKLRETLPYLDQQLAARRQLSERGHFSRLKLLEFEQLRVEHLRNIDVQRASAARSTAAMADIDAQLRRLRETFERSAATELADASDKAGVAEQEVRKTSKVRDLMQLRAPVDGVVQQLAVSTIGGVVQPAQPLLVIVPCAGGRRSPASCRSAIEVEAFVLNKDVGFVNAGQRVAVKLEAFNFTDYGLIEGRVVSVSRDSVTMNDKQGGGSDPNANAAAASPVYVARVALNCDGPNASALCRRAAPGMSAQAEIRTGSRRIINYLLSPLAKTVGEAGRER